MLLELHLHMRKWYSGFLQPAVNRGCVTGRFPAAGRLHLRQPAVENYPRQSYRTLQGIVANIPACYNGCTAVQESLQKQEMNAQPQPQEQESYCKNHARPITFKQSEIIFEIVPQIVCTDMLWSLKIQPNLSKKEFQPDCHRAYLQSEHIHIKSHHLQVSTFNVPFLTVVLIFRSQLDASGQEARIIPETGNLGICSLYC